MKKILLGLSLTLLTTSVFAQWHHGHHNHYYQRGGWGLGIVAPVIIGGVIGYELAQPRPVVVQQPVIINDPNLVVINGVIYRKVLTDVNGTMQEVLIRQ